MHLETKTGEKKERFIVVTKVASDEELKKKEKDKQDAEIVSMKMNCMYLDGFPCQSHKDASPVNAAVAHEDTLYIDGHVLFGYSQVYLKLD